MARKHHRRPAGYGREVWLLCIASALGSGSYLGMHQLLSALYVLRLGYGPETVGSLSATGAIAFSASCLIGGYLGTRLGTRRTLGVGVVIFALGMAMPPLAVVIPAAVQLGWLLVAQVVISLGWSMQVVSVIAAMAAVTDVRSRRSAYALREVFASVGMLLGALIGGLLPGAIAGLQGGTTDLPGPYALALWATVAGGTATLAPILLMGRVGRGGVPPTAVPAAVEPAAVEPTGAGTDTPRPRFRVGPALLLLAACGFATNAGHAACKTFAAVYMDTIFGLPTAVIGSVTSAGMGATALAALASGRLGRGRSSGHLMLAGALGMAAALVVMGMLRAPAGAMLGVIGVYGVLGLWRPAYQALQMEIARPEERSVVSGLSSMGMSLGFGSMGIVGGYLATGAGYPVVFFAGAGAALLSAALASILARKADRAGESNIDSQDR